MTKYTTIAACLFLLFVFLVGMGLSVYEREQASLMQRAVEKKKLFDEGRLARKALISPEANPYRSDSTKAPLWVHGWVHEDVEQKKMQ